MRGAEAEADDVIAALDYLQGLPFVDRDRIAVGGVSLGGLISVMAAANKNRLSICSSRRPDILFPFAGLVSSPHCRPAQ